MSTTTIIAGDAEYAARERVFDCPACREKFIAGPNDTGFELASPKDAYLLDITATCTCPTCGATAVSTRGTAGEVPVITGLVLHNLPDKTIYKPGEKFVATGLVIASVWSNGAVVDEALTGFTFSPDTDTALTTANTKIVATHTESSKTIDVPIAVRNAVIPLVELAGPDEFVYDGEAHEITVIRYNSDVMTRADYSKTSAGEYTAEYTPKTGYCWPDGTTAAVEIPWKIDKAVPTVTAPTGKTGLTYTGGAQELITAGTTTGGTMQYKLGSGAWGSSVPTATNAGTYTVKYRVSGGTNYEDVAEVALPDVVIAKATPDAVVLSEESLTLTAIATPGTFTVTRDGDGEITAVSSDETVCTVAVESGTVTVTAVADGTATVTVSVAEGTNYLAPEDATCAVTVELAEQQSQESPE